MAVSLHTPQNCDDMMQKHNKHLQAVSPTSSELFNCSSNLTTWQMKPQKPTKTHTVGHSPPFWLRIARSNIHQEHPVNMCRPLLSSSPSSLEAHCVELGFPADPRRKKHQQLKIHPECSKWRGNLHTRTCCASGVSLVAVPQYKSITHRTHKRNWICHPRKSPGFP